MTLLLLSLLASKWRRQGLFNVFCLSLFQDARVWSPTNLSRPICVLRGHPFALCGVAVFPNSPQAITADVSGALRLWDLRNFRAVQTFGGGSERRSSFESREVST